MMLVSLYSKWPSLTKTWWRKADVTSQPSGIIEASCILQHTTMRGLESGSEL